MKKKILALCLVVVLAVTAVTGVTLAYFTDTQDVTNTFTVGDIEIKLDEAEVERNGDEYEEKDTRTEEGNEYDEIYPGAKLPKDPTVTVLKGSEDSYIRMKVEVNVDVLKEAFPKSVTDEEAAEGKIAYPEMYNGDVFLLQNLVEGWSNTVWVPETTGIATSGTATYEFRYNGAKATDGIVKENDSDNTVLEDLFTAINIPSNIPSDQLLKLQNLSIKITAEAIQSAGFENAVAAWAAFPTK